MMVLEPKVKKHTAIQYTGDNFDSVKRFVGNLYDYSLVELNNPYRVKTIKELYLLSIYGTTSAKVEPGAYIVNDGYRFSVLSDRDIHWRYKMDTK